MTVKTFFPTICPQCGGSLPLVAKNVLVCEFCGTQLIVDGHTPPPADERFPYGPDFEVNDNCLVKYNGKGYKVEVPEGITAIRNGVFDDCANMESLRLPESLYSMSIFGFRGCKKLHRLVIFPDLAATILYHCNYSYMALLPKKMKNFPEYLPVIEEMIRAAYPQFVCKSCGSVQGFKGLATRKCYDCGKNADIYSSSSKVFHISRLLCQSCGFRFPKTEKNVYDSSGQISPYGYFTCPKCGTRSK